MDLSKWGDSVANVSADRVPRPRRGFRMLALLAMGSAVLAAGAWWILAGYAGSVLDGARERLDQAVFEDNSARRSDLCARAERDLVWYVGSPRGKNQSARALLWAAQAMQGRAINDTSFDGPLLPGECETRDLTTAAASFLLGGRLDLADWLIEEAMHREDRGKETLRWAGRIRYELGLGLFALAHYQELAELAPEDPEPWLKIAQIRERDADWRGTLDPLRRYIALHPPAMNYYRLHLVGYLTKAGDLEEARTEFDRLRTDDPALVQRDAMVEANLLVAENKPEEALRVLNERGPRDADQVGAARALEGKILLGLSQYEPAAAALRAAVAAEPSDHQAHFQLGTACLRLGKKQEAEKCFAEHERLRKIKREIHRLERTAGGEPANVEARLELARLCGEIDWKDLQQQWSRSADVARTLVAAPKPGRP